MTWPKQSETQHQSPRRSVVDQGFLLLERAGIHAPWLQRYGLFSTFEFAVSIQGISEQFHPGYFSVCSSFNFGGDMVAVQSRTLSD